VSIDDHYRKTGSGYSTDLTKSPYLQAEIQWLADNTPGFEYETYAKLNKEMVDLRPYKVEKVNFDLEGLDFFKQMTDPKNPGKFEELYKEVKEKEARVDDKFVTTDKERYDKAVEARNTYDESVSRLIKYFEKIMDQETQAGDKMRDYVKKARDTRKAEKENSQTNNIEKFNPKIDDVATILYTSGTTGKPKGVPLTHANFLHQIINLAYIADPEPGTSVLSVLPIWHSYERSAEYFFFSCGCSQYYTIPKFLKDDITQVKPVVMATVPRLWEAIHDGFFQALKKMPSK